jgi:hypothetical protein
LIESLASCAGKKIRRHQEKVWTFREERHKIGRGPAASIGDADDFALGLGADEFEDATPRRRCILDSLSLEAGPCCQLWHWWSCDQHVHVSHTYTILLNISSYFMQ